MTPIVPISTVARVRPKCQQHWVVVCRTIVLLIVASGLAVGFGATVERLTTPDVATRVSVDTMSAVPSVRSVTETWDQRYDGPPWAPRGESLANVFDGWYDDRTAATARTTGTARRHVVDRWYDEPAGWYWP
jgi:hypothetical protein